MNKSVFKNNQIISEMTSTVLIKKVLKKTYRAFTRQLKKIRELRTFLYKFVRYGNLRPKKDEVIFVDPAKICGSMRLAPSHRLRELTGYKYGVVIGGDWDIKDASYDGSWDKQGVRYLEFTDQPVYKSCYMRWIEGKPWSVTPVYKEYAKQIEKGRPTDYQSYEELEIGYKKLDRIFEEIRAKKRLSSDSKHLVTINMNRYGELIWGPNGRHRICIALILGLKEIPARPGFIHSDAINHFQNMRKEMFKTINHKISNESSIR